MRGWSYERIEAPDSLSDEDAQFLRHDLAPTLLHARTLMLAEGHNVSDYETEVVEMLPVPECFTDIEWQWAVVKPGTPLAVRFWRFRH